jgi:hypothetical protein
LFALLANVRGTNSTGFGYPRGLPTDTSELVYQISEGWGNEGHSHSHLYLRELMDFNWKGGSLGVSGFVTPEQAAEYKATGKPPSGWCAGTTDPTAVELKWKINIGQYCKGFTYLIKELKELGKPEDVRIIFWFDN